MNKIVCKSFSICSRRSGIASLAIPATDFQGKRSYHKSLGVPYQINQEHLREGVQDGKSILSPLPKTVSGNVKNVTGWRGGAERGFLSVYSDCIHVIRTEGLKFYSPDMITKYMKIFTHNLSSDVLGQRYGILVPITYRQLQPKASKEEMQLAHILGWCVELVRAGSIVGDDVCRRSSLSPRGSSEIVTANNASTQERRSPNDALTLDAGVFVLLKHLFQKTDHVKYAGYVDAVLEAQQFGVMGRNIHLSLGHVGCGKKLAGFEIQAYKNLIRTTVCQTNFCLPISLALHLANLSDPRIHEIAHSVLHGISYFLQVTRDYVNCYVDPFGSDIKEGRITWLVIIARQRANSTQLATLEEHYGRPEAESVSEVKRVYNELNLKKILTAHMNETREDIHKMIQQISSLDDVGLNQEFFFKLMENMNNAPIS